VEQPKNRQEAELSEAQKTAGELAEIGEKDKLAETLANSACAMQY
jgi:hypothetical protein